MKSLQGEGRMPCRQTMRTLREHHRAWVLALPRGEAMAKDGSAAVKRVCVRDQGWEQGDLADDGPTRGPGETTAV